MDTYSFDDKVVDYSTSTIHPGNPWIIMFFAPWCGHCKALKPVWEELWKAQSDKVNVAKVDCTKPHSKPVCKQFKVKGYPTILYFDNKTMYYQYKGKRDLQSLESYVLDGGYKKHDGFTVSSQIKDTERPSAADIAY